MKSKFDRDMYLRKEILEAQLKLAAVPANLADRAAQQRENLKRQYLEAYIASLQTLQKALAEEPEAIAARKKIRLLRPLSPDNTG